MRILHVITSTSVGGAEIMLQRYLEACGTDAQSHEVLVLRPDGPISDRIRQLGVRVTSLNFARFVPSLRVYRQLRQTIEAAAADLVVGWMYHACLAAEVGVRRGDGAPPVVWSIHHSLADIRNEKRSTQLVIRALRRLSQRADGIVYCSDVSRRQHEAFGFAPGKATTIANGIDTDAFAPADRKSDLARRLCGLDEDRVLIGNVGRAHPMKDHANMVHAVAELTARGRSCHGLFVGAGHETGEMAALARSLGIEDRITALGVRDDIAEIMAGLDIYMLSSAWGEAFPLVLGEAMASGIPVITTDVGDTALLVGDFGAVVPPKAPGRLADAVETLLDMSPEARSAYGTQGRAHIVAQFSMPTYVARHHQVFEAARAAKT